MVKRSRFNQGVLWPTVIPAVTVFVGVALAWELFARLADNTLFLPTPSEVAKGFVQMYLSGTIYPHIWASLFRCMSGFLLAAAIAIPFGVVTGYFLPLRRHVDPLVELLRPVPPLALIPLLILWFGIGELSKVVLIFIACFFPIFISSEHGVARVDRSLIRAGALLGATKRDIMWKIVIPGAMPEIFTGLRISLAISLLAIIAAELVAADRGLGFLILDSERRYDTVAVFVGIITIALLGFLFDVVLRKLRQRIMPWFDTM